MNNKQECCFCGKQIEVPQENITGLIVVSNWDKERNSQREQQLFCHMECLRDKINPNVPLYIADLID